MKAHLPSLPSTNLSVATAAHAGDMMITHPPELPFPGNIATSALHSCPNVASLIMHSFPSIFPGSCITRMSIFSLSNSSNTRSIYGASPSCVSNFRCTFRHPIRSPVSCCRSSKQSPIQFISLMPRSSSSCSPSSSCFALSLSSQSSQFSSICFAQITPTPTLAAKAAMAPTSVAPP